MEISKDNHWSQELVLQKSQQNRRASSQVKKHAVRKSLISEVNRRTSSQIPWKNGRLWKLYADKFHNLDKMSQFLEIHNLPRLRREGTDHVNRLISIGDWINIDNLPNRKPRNQKQHERIKRLWSIQTKECYIIRCKREMKIRGGTLRDIVT